MRSVWKKSRRMLLSFPLLVAFSVAAAQAADLDSEPAFKSAADLRANLPPNIDRRISVYPIMMGSQIQMLAAHAVRTGEAEKHGAIDVFYYVEDGSADVLMGRDVEGGHQRSPDEWGGGKIVGGQTFHLSKGDVLLIPAGWAHQVVVPPNGSFTYYVFRHASTGTTGK